MWAMLNGARHSQIRNVVYFPNAARDRVCPLNHVNVGSTSCNNCNNNSITGIDKSHMKKLFSWTVGKTTFQVNFNTGEFRLGSPYAAVGNVLTCCSQSYKYNIIKFHVLNRKKLNFIFFDIKRNYLMLTIYMWKRKFTITSSMICMKATSVRPSIGKKAIRGRSLHMLKETDFSTTVDELQKS